jgi:cation diffusion facilitator family transporter
VPAAERRAALLAVGLGIFETTVKFVAYFLTGSSAIFSDALEPIVNVVGALLALYALGVAHRTADADHPYGHGKIEFLSASAEGSMIVVAGVVIFVQAGRSILHPGLNIERLGVGLVLMVGALVLNGAAGLYLLGTSRRGNSATLWAHGQHLLADATVSAAAIAAVLFVRLTHQAWVDPVVALAVGCYFVATGARVVRRSAAGLMDEQDEEDRRLLERILDGHLGPDGQQPRIGGYHKLRHRHSGRYHWIDFHLLLPAHFDIAQAHRVASALEHEIEVALGEGDAPRTSSPARPRLVPAASSCRSRCRRRHQPARTAPGRRRDIIGSHRSPSRRNGRPAPTAGTRGQLRLTADHGDAMRVLLGGGLRGGPPVGRQRRRRRCRPGPRRGAAAGRPTPGSVTMTCGP